MSETWGVHGRKSKTNGHGATSGREMREGKDGLRVSSEFFSALGVPPALGRTLAKEEDDILAVSSHFRSIAPGVETLYASFSLPRHRHLRAYTSVVLAGTFEESGYIGRIRATTGDVLVHPAMDCHQNRWVSAGVKLIRLYWPDVSGVGGLYRIDDVDELARTAEKDVCEAALLLREVLTVRRLRSPGEKNDWPDQLARALTQNASMQIGVWAEANCLAPETVSRGFASAYGITPSVFRAELRTRAAWLLVTRRPQPLSAIASETGFADQAHMTRWVHRVTGAPPNAWRQMHSRQCGERGSS